MTLLLLSPLGGLILQAQFWLFTHNQFWLALHLPQIVKWVFGFGPPTLLVLENIREAVWLWAIPAKSWRLHGRGESDRAITLMRRSIGAFTPFLGTRPLYLKRLYRLGQMLETARRTGEANEVWEEILKRPALASGFEADVRKRLANGLETIGDTSAATRQRALVEDRLQRGEQIEGSGKWSILLERGKDAADSARFPEAQDLLERALAAPKIGVQSSQRTLVDVEIAARLALVAYKAGDTTRAESAARLVVADGNSPFWRAQGFRTLALSLGTQNRLNEALEASRASLYETVKQGNPDSLAEARAGYALLLMQCGQVREALYECETAADMGTGSSRTACHLASTCLVLLGDYEAGRSWLEKARRTPHYSNPATERRTQGLFSMEGANIELAATQYGGQNCAQTAWDLLQRAKPNLVGFERMLYWASACEMLTMTFLGQHDAACARLAQVEAQLPNYEGDTATQNAIWTWLAKTYMQLEQWSDAEKWWRLYLDSGQGRPVYGPGSLCSLGECRLARNDKAGARSYLQEAVAMNFDIADTTRAHQRLEAL